MKDGSSMLPSFIFCQQTTGRKDDSLRYIGLLTPASRRWLCA